MIRHIFTKDWRQLWKLAVGVTLIGLIQHVVLSHEGIFYPDPFNPLVRAENALRIVSLCGIAVFIVILVQQESIPGLRQDWLVRPVPRRDLLLSKLLFVVLAVQAPIFLMEVVQSRAAGFSLSQSLSAPFSRSLWMLFAFDLPVMAFAALTRNFRDGVIAALALLVGNVVVLTVLPPPNRSPFWGFSWVTDSAQLLIGLSGVAAVLALQYFRRRTLRARWVCACTVVVWLCVQWIPWGAAFAVQKQFSMNRTAADTVQIAFHPDHPVKLQTHLWVDPRVASTVSIPMRVTGENYQDTRRITDRVVASAFTRDGGVIALVPEPKFDFESHEDLFQTLGMSDDTFARLKDQHVRLELDYSMTLMKIVGTPTLSAISQDQPVPGVGRCSTRLIPESERFGIGCMNPGVPPCYTWSVGDFENEGGCRPDFAPWFGRIEGDSMNRTGGMLQAEAHIDPAALKNARIRFVVYRPQAHLTRHVVIPDIRLGDWTGKHD